MPDKKGIKQEKSTNEVINSIVTGVFIFPNGNRYDGEYSNLPDGSIIRHGFGEHTAVNGLTYKGSWQNDKMNGLGTVHYLSGASYTGEFVDNKMHGNGVYTFPDQSIYKGMFLENRLQGDGEFHDANGQEWCGKFMNKNATQLEFKLKM